MANVQLQRTVNAATCTKTTIDQNQSLEVMQTMLHGGLSTLAYLRNFFGDKAFEAQVYEMAEKIHSYEEYAAGKLTKNEKTAIKPKTKIQILRRNRSKRADVFLDWLERGVFTALKNSTLYALQIYVHDDPTDRKKVIEKYTFTVKYLPGPEGGRIPAEIEMDTSANSLVSVGATNKALQDLLREIIDLCKPLPKLPDHRFVTMEIFYTEETLRPYPAKGWVTSTSDKLFFAQAEGWQRRVERPQDLQSGFHSASVKISHLQPMYHELLETPALPETLQYYEPCSKQEDLDLPEIKSGVTEVGEDFEYDTAPTSADTPSTLIEIDTSPKPAGSVKNGKHKKLGPVTPLPTSDQPASMSKQMLNADQRERSRSHTAKAPVEGLLFDESADTQSSNIPSMTQALKSMLQPEFLTQGDTQTQSLAHGFAARDERNKNTGRTDLSFLRPSGKPHRTVTIRTILTQRTTDRLDDMKLALRSTARQLAKAGGENPKLGELILCQCGCGKDEGDMVCCVYCETWQHLHCYGYTGANDPRLSLDHVCYQCLLGEREEETLRKLCDLAQKRRGMNLALEKGLKTQRNFARDMDLKASVGDSLFQHFKQEGYVVAAKGSRKAGYAASGKPLFVAVQDGPNHQKMLRNLFDPIMHISHHFESTRGTTVPLTALSEQLQALQGDKMPPPVTPAWQLKQNSQTPSTGLDLRASMTPSKTPIRLHSSQTRAAKRGRDHSDEMKSPPKRRATSGLGNQRLKSVQTAYMLDVGDISPAPTLIHGSDYIVPSSDS